MILEWLDSCAGTVRRAARRSRLLSSFAKLPLDYEAFGKSSRREELQPSRRFRLHRLVLRWQEQSFCIALGRKWLAWLLQSSLGSIAVFLLTFSAISLAGTFWRNAATLSSLKMMIPLGVLISAIPLLASPVSCAEGIRRGRILSWIFFDFCGLSDSVFEGTQMGIERRWSPLFFGSLLGGISAYFHPMSAILLLLSPIAVSLLLAVPELAAVGVLFALPFLNLLRHPTLALLVCLSVCFLAWVGKAVSGKRQTDFTRMDLIVLLFSLCYLLGGAFSSGGRESLLAGGMRCVILVFSWFPMRALLVSRFWRRRAMRALCASSAIVSAYGIFQYVSGRALLAWVDLSRFSDIGGRVTSFFENPNLLAVYLLLTVPLSLGMLFAAERLIDRLLFGCAFLLGSFCVVLTWSRGAWIGWMLAVLFFLLCYRRRSLALLLASPVPILSAVLWLPSSVLNRFGSIGNFSESSIRYRLYTWRGVRAMLASKPFGIGVGDTAFHAVFPRFALSGTERVMHAHQLFLQIAAELGIPSLLLFLIILWRLARRTARGLRKTVGRSARAELLGPGGAMLGALAMGLFDDIWYHGGTFCLFWIIAALLFDLTEREEGLT